MIDTTVLLSIPVFDYPWADMATGTVLGDSAASSFSPDDTNTGYFWASPSNAFGFFPAGIFIHGANTLDDNDSIPNVDIQGSTFGGVGDPGSTLGLSLQYSPINIGNWSDANALTFAPNNSAPVQYWS